MIKQYFVNACYNSLIGDTAPLAAANALAINIVILDSITPHILCHASVEHRFTLPSSGTVYVYLHSEHCSCISIVRSRSLPIVTVADELPSFDASQPTAMLPHTRPVLLNNTARSLTTSYTTTKTRFHYFHMR